MKTCPTHNKELRYIPGGISKRGNRYESFWGCPAKECAYSENPDKEEKKKYDAEARMRKMDTEFTKQKSMAHFNAVNNAIALQEGKVDWVEFEAIYNKLYKKWEDFFMSQIINEE